MVEIGIILERDLVVIYLNISTLYGWPNSILRFKTTKKAHDG